LALPGENNIYEDLETIRAQKKALEERDLEKANPDPENGEREHSKNNESIKFVTVNENVIINNGQVQINNGASNGMLPNSQSPINGAQNDKALNGETPSDMVPDGEDPNCIVQNGIAANIVIQNGALPNGAVPNGVVVNGPSPNGIPPNGVVPNGFVPNGVVPNGVVPNGHISGERKSSLDFLNSQNMSAAVFTAQVPMGYHTLPNGVGSGKKTDKEPIYAKPGQYSKTNKKKKLPKVKFNVPKGLAPGDTLPKSPTTPKTPEVPPKSDVMY
jgi:hypothetical protein